MKILHAINVYLDMHRSFLIYLLCITSQKKKRFAAFQPENLTKKNYPKPMSPFISYPNGIDHALKQSVVPNSDVTIIFIRFQRRFLFYENVALYQSTNFH